MKFWRALLPYKSLPVNGQVGLSLIEVLVAMAIMGFTAAFIGGVYTALAVTPINEDSINAEALAKSQLEYVKAQAYDETNNPPVYDVMVRDGYFITADVVRTDPEGDGDADDDGVQKVTVCVYRGNSAAADNLIITLVGYKLK